MSFRISNLEGEGMYEINGRRYRTERSPFPFLGLGFAGHMAYRYKTRNWTRPPPRILSVLFYGLAYLAWFNTAVEEKQ